MGATVQATAQHDQEPPRRARLVRGGAFPLATTAILCGSPGGGRSVLRRRRPRATTPRTTAEYSRVTERACSCRTRSTCAGIVLATASNPLVSLSSPVYDSALGTPES